MRAPWWVMLAVVVVLIGASTFLVANGNIVPDWFRDIAFALVGGAAGNALPTSRTP